MQHVVPANRHQVSFSSLEELIAPDDPVRFLETFAEKMNLILIGCPLRKPCIGEETKFKKIENSIYQPHCDKMHEKLQTMHAKSIQKKEAAPLNRYLEL